MRPLVVVWAGLAIALIVITGAESCAAKQGGQYVPLKPGALRAP